MNSDIYNAMNKKISPYLHSLPAKAVRRVLFGCGLLLLAGELYKQLFLYFFINGQSYDWWYFPFQLCSLPMYLCLMQRFLPNGRVRQAVCTFMRDFNLVGGLAALAVPEGFRHIHWTLTLHGYCWHIMLIFIGLFLWATGSADDSWKGYLRTLPLFAAFCLIATAINLLAPGRGQADMFYISPYHPSTQPVIHELALIIGTIPASLIYLAAIAAAAAAVHAAFAHFPAR